MVIRNAAASKLVNPKVLLFGPKAFFTRVSAEFELLGYDVVTLKDLGLALPSPFELGATEKMRQILAAFELRAGEVAEVRNHAIYPGVTAWSERVELGSLGAEFGLDVLSPPPRILSLFTNKIGLIETAEKLQIPHIVLSFEPVQTVREAITCLEREYGQSWEKKAFPIVFKSVRGGVRGLGVRVFYSFEELEREFSQWIEQIRSITGDAVVIPEKYLEGARYLMQPYVRFADGRMRLFPVVDASLQVRRRRMIEFCPAEGVDAIAQKNLEDWTRKFARHIGFVGVGSFDFLCDGDRTFLIDGLARLNYGYHLWESVAGTSAIQWQMATMGLCDEPSMNDASERPVWNIGASLRLYAEDSMLQLPAPGTIFEFSDQKHFQGVNCEAKLESGYGAGDVIPNDSAGLLGILWASAQNRDSLIHHLENSLDQIWITGSINTNENYLSQILEHNWVKEGAYHASFLEEEFVPVLRPPAEWMSWAVTIVSRSLAPSQNSNQGTWLVSEKKIAALETPIPWDGFSEKFVAGGFTGLRGRLNLDDQLVPFCAYPVIEGRWLVRIGNWRLGVRVFQPGGPIVLSALCAGRIHSLFFRPESVVPAKEPIALIQSLQVLVTHALPTSVKLLEWRVKSDQEVSLWEPLATLERVKSGANHAEL